MRLGWRGRIAGMIGALSLVTTSLEAQLVPRAGRGLYAQVPTTPLVLRVPASANALGMGNVGVLLRDAEAVFYNVGMLTQARGVGTSLQRYGSDATAGSIASVQTLGGFSYGVGARFLSSRAPVLAPPAQGNPFDNSIALDTSSVPSTGMALTAALGRAVGPLRIGLGATYVREASGPVVDDATLFDVGVVYPIGPLNLSLNVQHIGSTLRSAPFAGVAVPPEAGNAPWQAVLGFGGANAPVGTFLDLSVYSQLAVDQSGTLRPAFGTELAYVPVDGVSLALRTGVRRTELSSAAAVTAGIGLSIDRYSIDYAIEPFVGAPDAHRIGVRVRP